MEPHSAWAEEFSIVLFLSTERGTASIIGVRERAIVANRRFARQICSGDPDLGARVRHMLDMRSGIRFSEEYLEPDAEVRFLDQAVGWVPRVDDCVPESFYDYLPLLTAARPHGGPFEYRSCETDVLGWVCERAGGDRLPNLLSRLVWSPIAEQDVDAGVDRAGAVFADGGLAATLRDVGRLLCRGGLESTAWIDDALRGVPCRLRGFTHRNTVSGRDVSQPVLDTGRRPSGAAVPRHPRAVDLHRLGP